jgi:hypothetical protein
MEKVELLTAKKIADKMGVSAKLVTDFIIKNSLEPVQIKGPCKYYGANTLKKIEKGIKK